MGGGLNAKGRVRREAVWWRGTRRTSGVDRRSVHAFPDRQRVQTYVERHGDQGRRVSVRAALPINASNAPLAMPSRMVSSWAATSRAMAGTGVPLAEAMMISARR